MYKIIIYTNEQCPYCKQVKEELTKNEIEFENRFTKDFEDQWRNISGLTKMGMVPTIYHQGDYLVAGRDFPNPTILVDILKNYTISTFRDLYLFSDSNSNLFNPDDGLINSSYNGADLVSATRKAPSEVTGHTGNATSRTPGDWAVLPQKEFFIDNMFMIAGVLADDHYARHTGQSWFSGVPAPVDQGSYTIDPWSDIIYTGGTTFPRANWRKYYTQSHIMWFPPRNVIKPTSITTTGGTTGDKLINGLEGIITTDLTHTGPTNAPGSTNGIRRWKTSFYGSNVETNTYGTTNSTGKFYMHLSFLAPGEDLHDNTGWPTRYSLSADGGKTSSISAQLQGIWGGGVFTNEDGSLAWGQANNPSSLSDNNYAVFMEYARNRDPFYYPNLFDRVIGYDDSYANRHNNQWNPFWPPGSDSDNKIQQFINNLDSGKKFRFQGDTEVYTILSKRVKKLYNHTSWRKTFENDGSGNLVATGRSVEEAALAWAATTDYQGKSGNQTEYDAVRQRIVDFGKANNRRLVYILELDKDPTQSATYNPVDGIKLGAETANPLEFVIEDFELSAGETTQQPAIWETEPKDNVDLDIYYEASQPYPIKLTKETRELFAPVGSKVEILNLSEARDGSIDLTTTEVILEKWDDIGNEQVVVLSPGFNINDSSGGVINYNFKQIRFYREDGSYTTGKINIGAAYPITSAGLINTFQLDTSIDAAMEIGLNWYNCFSFGNGIESNRIRDDFNAMIIKNGVKASSTMNRPYQEDRRASGLIYSNIYNSTNDVNGLNQFIAAEKITKDLNPTYGSIQKLFQRRSSASYGDTLIAFCEDRVIGITSNKDALYNADGKPQLISSNAVLGDANPFIGDYGISKNPESFASESYRAYFTDKQRGAVLRLSMDGLTPISDAGMRDYFRDNLFVAGKLIGTYDEHKKDYNLTLTNYLPENIITNAAVDQGESIQQNVINPDDIIVNGGINNGSNWTPASFPNQELFNSTLSSKTTITNYDEIPLGSLMPAAAEIPAVPPQGTGLPNGVSALGTPAVFTQGNVYLWAYGGTANPFFTAGAPSLDNLWVYSDGTQFYNTNPAAGAGSVYYYASNTGSWAYQKVVWNNTDHFVGLDLSILPTSSGVGTNTPTTTNADGNSVATLYGGKNNTFYNGEELEIAIKLKQGTNVFNNEPTLKISLYDGDVPADGGTTNLVPETNLQIITSGSAPYENIGSTGFDTVTSLPSANGVDYEAGFVDENPFTFPTLSHTNVTGQNSNSEFAEKWHIVAYKICDGTTNEGIVINDLRVKIEIVENNVFCATDNFRIRKIYSLSIPKENDILVGSTSPLVPEVFAEPPYDVPAFAEVSHSIDTDSDSLDDWSNTLSGSASINLHANAITQYGAEFIGSSVTGSQNSVSSNGIAPQTWYEPQRKRYLPVQRYA